MSKPLNAEALGTVLAEIAHERARQHAKFGEQNWPDGTGGEWRETISADKRIACELAFQNKTGTFAYILDEEWAEAMAETSPKRLRAELVQVAAVAIQWIEAIDRRKN